MGDAAQLKTTRPPFLGWLLAGGLAAGVFALWSFPIWRYELERFIQRPLSFDRAIWDARQNSWGDAEHRAHRMADEMLRSGWLIGKTRQEVVARLGEPPPTDYFDEYDLVYGLGAERGFFSIDSEWLVLNLDAAGRVSEATLARD